MSIKFLGTGYYVPDFTLTNDDIAKMVETSDEWIMQRVGVHERRISVDQTTGEMGALAAKRALEASGLSAGDLDLIIAATITPDSLCPTVAGTVQSALGATCPAFDLNSACSGFLFALDTAVSFIMRGSAKNVLVLGAERLSKLVNWKDRSTCVIFGDGAGAAVVTAGDGYLASTLSTKGGSEVLDVPAYAGSSPFYHGPIREQEILMNGQETFKFAVSRIVDDIKYVAEKAGIALSDIDHVVPHQANIRIIDYASKRLGIPMEKFFVNIQKYGNTSAASVPIALAELDESGKLKRNDTVVLTAFGGGLSDAACIIKW